MTNIEIILINDFSNDNTLKIIKNFKRYEQRIMLINNKKNMGTLYSRSIGVLKAKGDYIFSLDNDDMYFDYDVLGYIYKRITQESLDIIGFLTINLWNYTASINKMKNIFTYLYPDEFYLEQPELRTWMIKFKGKYLVHNNMIWDKCIKSLIYKKALNIMGYNRYSNYLSWAEDTSILFIIFNLAKSFKYIYKYGILHFKGNITSSLTQSIDTKIFGEIFFLDILYTFSKNNTEDKNLIVGQAYYIYMI
jgi:glycosyltransferase involved in cell wall biosynthesis